MELTKEQKQREENETLLNELQRHGVGKDLVLTTARFDLYDAHNNNVVIEFKNTNQILERYLIEAVKLVNTYNYAEVNNKTFFYIVFNPQKIYIWNITKEVNNERFFQLERRFLPYDESAYLNGGKKINKLIAWLHTSEATRTIKRKK